MHHYLTPDVIDQAHDALWGLGVAFAVVAGRLGFGHLRYHWYQHQIDRRMARHGGMPLEELRELERSRGDLPDPVTAESIAGAASTMIWVLALILGVPLVSGALEDSSEIPSGAWLLLATLLGLCAAGYSYANKRPEAIEFPPEAKWGLLGGIAFVGAIVALVTLL